MWIDILLNIDAALKVLLSGKGDYHWINILTWFALLLKIAVTAKQN